MTEKQTIINQADLRKWRTEIPNMYDDAGLDPFAFRLLVHYVRVGSCWEATRTTADKCGMSPAQVVGKRRELAKAGWITLGENKKGTIQIEIVDRWAENFQQYCSPDKQQPSKRSPRKRKRSPHEQKKEPIKKQPENEEPLAAKPRTQKQEVTALLTKAFEEVSGIKEPEYTTSKQQRAMAVRWWNPLWTIFKTCDKFIGTSESLIARTIEQMRADGLTIAAPQSILNVAISIHGASNANTTNGTTQADEDHKRRIDKALGSRRV